MTVFGTTAWLACVLNMAMVAAPSSAMSQQPQFDEGNQLYLSGDFAGALDRYEQIVNQGYASAPLYYNIGNAYFKLGDVGRAVLYYERALRKNPRSADVQANLELARSLAPDEITPLPTFWVIRVWNWWVHLLPSAWLAAMVGSLYVATMVAITLAILGRGSSVTWGRRVALATGALFVVFGVNLAAQWFAIGQPDEAVIVADEVLVQSAPSDDRALQVFTIHTGTKVRVDQLTGDWAEIVLADGKVGWIRRDTFEII